MEHEASDDAARRTAEQHEERRALEGAADGGRSLRLDRAQPGARAVRRLQGA